MNLVVIVSDTFRADHLGCYGNTHIRTPHLDELAGESLQFDNFYHSSFPTMPLRADLFTGKLTCAYLGWAPLPAEETILAETLQKGGYTTIAAVDTPFFVRRGYGYDRGFKDFNWIVGQGDKRDRPRVNAERRFESDYMAPKTMLAAERLIEFYRKEKFFLYVDMWDPHEPWDPPPWYVDQYYPGGWDGRLISPPYWYYKERGISEEDMKIARACYCGEITMVDLWVGRFVDKLKAMGLWEDTALLFTSDHGYYFGEHGFFGKGLGSGSNWIQSPLFREVTHIPFLLRVPGLKARRVEELGTSTDIMPTLLDLAGVEIPGTVQGKSLVPLIKGGNPAHDFVVSSFPLYNPGEPSRIVDDWLRTTDAPHFTTVTTDRWTFLYSTEQYPAQLYDIRQDPGETTNVIAKHWDVAEDLHAKLREVLEKAGTSEAHMSIRRKLKKA